MTMTRGFAARVAAAAAAGVIASAATVSAVAAADPQECASTVGESASQQVQSYLDRHPDVKRELTERGRSESPGSPDPLLDYLQRHDHVRQALVTLANQCVS